jgi:hypothetical protein
VSEKIARRVSVLRERAQVFNAVMADLQRMGPALRSDRVAHNEWRQLILDGNAIRAAIQTSGKMIDGAAKWVAKTFQRKALDAIPFAADVVHATTDGSVSAIDHFIDRAKKAIVKFRPLFESFSGLDEKERQRLAALPVEQVKKSAVPALLLIAILGSVAYWAAGGNLKLRRDRDDDPDIFDYD